MEDEDSSLLSAQAQSSVTMKKQFRKRHSNKQASNASDASNKPGGPPMSREERKNEQIIKMIERQDKLNMRREKKKQGLQVRKLLFYLFRSQMAETVLANLSLNEVYLMLWHRHRK